jgi:peroxiredoxin
MLKRIFALLLLAASLAFAVRTPRPLADVPIPTPNGKTIDLKQYRGKVVLIALISTSCSDCIASIDLLNKLQAQFGPRGFSVIGVATGLDVEKNIKGFVDRYRPGFPVGYITEQPFRKLADIGPDDRPYVPMFMFIDKKGTVRFEYTAIDGLMEKSQRAKASSSIVEGLLRQ